MEETSTPASVSMQVVRKASPTRSRHSPTAPRSWIPRPAYVAIAFVLILTVGWGTFSIIGRQSQDNDEVELADLEGFDAESPSLGTPEPQTKQALDGSASRDFTSRLSVDRENPWSAPPAPGSFEVPALSPTSDLQATRLDRVPFATNMNQQATSGAWLIGTIEADEAQEQIALPPRVSQTVADGPLFR